MRMKFTSGLIALALAGLLAAPAAMARTLALAPALVSLKSDEGVAILNRASARAPYIDLSMQFVTQKTQSFCGVASIGMVLNALDVDAPSQPEYEPYRVFTQDDFFNEETEKVRPRALIDRRPVVEVPAPLHCRTAGSSKLQRGRELKRHLALILRLLSSR